MKNEHDFDFRLPLHPSGNTATSLLMDGKPLQGVSGLFIRAGANGFTNVSIEFEAGAAAKFAAELTASVEADEEVLSDIYDVALDDAQSILFEGESLENSKDARAKFVNRILELAVEKL